MAGDRNRLDKASPACVEIPPRAGVAQLVEHPICNRAVGSSSLSASTISPSHHVLTHWFVNISYVCRWWLMHKVMYTNASQYVSNRDGISCYNWLLNNELRVTISLSTKKLDWGLQCFVVNFWLEQSHSPLFQRVALRSRTPWLSIVQRLAVAVVRG